MSNVIFKSMEILRVLSPREAESEKGVTEISRELHIPVQTVYRLLSLLSEAGLVSQNSKNKKYRLGLTLMYLGFQVWENLSIRNVARPIMEELAKKTKESIYLTLCEGEEGIYLDTVNAPRMLRIMEPIGLRIPLDISAGNKVILAYMPERTLNQVLRKLAGKEMDNTVKSTILCKLIY